MLTLFPILSDALKRAAAGVRTVVIPEENLFGLYRSLLTGAGVFEGARVVGVNGIGSLVSPEEIIAEVVA